MNKSRLLSTAAVALMLSAGAAYAQAPSKDQAPAQPAPAAQQNAPAEKVAPNAPVRPAQTSPNAASTQSAADSKTDMNKTDMNKADMKIPPAAAQAETKTETKTETKSSADAAKPDATKPDATKASDANKAGAPAAAATTGQGAGAAARLTTEQRSKITTVIKQQKVQPVTLNVSIRVGTRVPSSVRYSPLPVEVVTIYPEWRGYDYILVGDQIVIIDPRSHEIVAIIEA